MSEMSDTKLAPEQFAQIIQEKKPYLLAIEEAVQRVQHGKIDLCIDVRTGNVEKMEFIEKKNWLREKSVQNVQVSQTVIMSFVQNL